jgi:hypothetical protein
MCRGVVVRLEVDDRPTISQSYNSRWNSFDWLNLVGGFAWISEPRSSWYSSNRGHVLSRTELTWTVFQQLGSTWQLIDNVEDRLWKPPSPSHLDDIFCCFRALLFWHSYLFSAVMWQWFIIHYFLRKMVIYIHPSECINKKPLDGSDKNVMPSEAKQNPYIVISCTNLWGGSNTVATTKTR